MKTGDRFASYSDMQHVMKKVLGKSFPQNGWIHHLSNVLDNPNYHVCVAKHVFYNNDFPAIIERWNEFEDITKAEVARKWNDSEWLKSDATEVVHEIFSPLENPAKPGAHLNGLYEPIPGDTEKTRLIFGNFRDSINKPGNNYVFLGVYELDEVACKNVNGYGVDAASFPLKACKMNSNIITYPHQVWRRMEESDNELMKIIETDKT